MKGEIRMKAPSNRDNSLDWPRIVHLLKLGIFAALLVLLGDMLLGDHAITNALATGWISVGNLWMMGGLLIVIKKGGKHANSELLS